MVPPLIRSPNARGSRLLYPIASFIVNQAPKVTSRLFNYNTTDAEHHVLRKRAEELPASRKVIYAILIPILVLLSGLFAGLTLGYMSLDETQLHVLSISGTPKQKEYARKIQPIRKNGHLLLITLILANMIANETLPVIFDPLLGGLVGVVASTALIVIFAEIIPQSVCTRYGLAIGANMAWFVRILIFALGIISWPVAKFLELILGSHHGIMYRRAELKELIAMHSSNGEFGGDLKTDTVTIIGATLDLQEKVVRQAMTPISKVFMLNKYDKLDHDTMKRIYDTGHSRIPIYEEVELPLIGGPQSDRESTSTTIKPRVVKKIIGVFLVKQCLMLDPKDATPISTLPLNALPSVPSNFSLLQMLDKFQEGRSHMAVVSRMSYEKAASVKQEVKKGLTRRLKERVGMGDSSSSESSDDEVDVDATASTDGSSQEGTLNGGHSKKRKWGRRRKSKKKSNKNLDLEKGDGQTENSSEGDPDKVPVKTTWEKISIAGREQSMPDDAVLLKDGAEELLQNLDPMVMPLGIITLEDVLEELIGEEIYDEFDPEGHSHLAHYNPPSKRKISRGPGATTNLDIPAVQLPTSVDPTTDPTSDKPELEERSHSQPPSRNPSFVTSLSALVSHKKQRGRSSSRTRQRQNLSASDTDLVRRVKAPIGRSEGKGRVSPHREESGEEEERIPSDADRHGPDISGDNVEN